MIEDIPWALGSFRSRQNYKLYRDYYDGNHRLLFATEKFRNAFGDMFQNFSDNLCAPVVDSVSDRLQVRGFDAQDQPELTERIDDLWTLNRMDRRSGEVHSTALKEADSYVIVWPATDGNVRIWPQNPENITVHYDEEQSDLIDRERLS